MDTQEKLFAFFVFQSGFDDQNLGTKNSTDEDHSPNSTGFQRVLLSHFVFSFPNRQCYTQFFVQAQPPVGLRRPDDAYNRYICQPPTPNQRTMHTYYATMFDEDWGIAVFSAYTLRKAPDLFKGRNPGVWTATPGNLFACTKETTFPIYIRDQF